MAEASVAAMNERCLLHFHMMLAAVHGRSGRHSHSARGGTTHTHAIGACGGQAAAVLPAIPSYPHRWQKQAWHLHLGHLAIQAPRRDPWRDCVQWFCTRAVTLQSSLESFSLVRIALDRGLPEDVSSHFFLASLKCLLFIVCFIPSRGRYGNSSPRKPSPSHSSKPHGQACGTLAKASSFEF